MLLHMTVITVCYRSRRTRRKKSSTTSATTRRRQTDKRRYQRSAATTPPSSRFSSVTSPFFRPTKQRRRSAAMEASAWRRHGKRQYISHAPSIKARKGQTYRDPVYGAAWREKMRAKYTDAVYRAAWSHRMRQTMPRRMRVNRANPNFRATERRKLQQSRHLKRVSDPVAVFTQHIQEGPIYSCVSCHRHLYRQTVVKLNMSRCKSESRQLLSAMLAAFNSKKLDQLYICHTCQTYVRRKQVSCQATINGHKLEDTPKQLRLTELECALIAQRVPFIKVLALPRG